MKYIKAHFALLALLLVFNAIGNILIMPLTAHAAGSYPVYRLYDKNSGEHFYTRDAVEMQKMIYFQGWKLEGEGFYGESGGVPVYRLKNPVNGDHHYTTSSTERSACMSAGWKYEGIAWEASNDDSRPVYRLYNPNKKGAGSHHYTMSVKEKDHLVKYGWKYEGISWYSAAEENSEEQKSDNYNKSLENQLALQIVEYTNIQRKNAGLSPLEINEDLMKAAGIRAKEASVNYSHTRTNGTKCYTVLDELGIPQSYYNGENLAANHSTYANCAENVVKSWMNSSGHKANILRETSDTIGVGCYINEEGQAYFIQIFGRYHTEKKIYTWNENEIIIPTN